MAQDTTQETILAIAFVVESSLPVYQQWGVILKDYLTHILKRLADTFPGSRMRVAFITYGPADIQQSPLLCKRFFVDHHVVFKEMKDSPGKLGFGQANTGGARGMAALEGHVAALELFDILNEPSETKRGRVLSNFVFHIAACPPDSSRYPQWNELAALDRTTWNTLPEEYRKRNVMYNAIILSSQLPQFASLHLAHVRTESKPWFSVKASHIVLLSGIPTAEPRAAPAKRPGDHEKTPESKRLRLVQNKLETSTHPNRSMSEQQGQSDISQTTSFPTSSQQGLVAQFRARLRASEDNVRALEAKISEAQLAGNKELADKLSLDCRHQKDILTSFQRRVLEHMQSLKTNQTASTFSGSHAITAHPVVPGQDASASALAKGQKQRPGGLVQSSHPQGTDLLPIYRQASENVDGLSSSLPEIASMPQHKSPSEQVQGTMMQSSTNTFSAHLQPPSHSTNIERGHSATNSLVWQGQFIWNGLGSTGKKECRARVVAFSQNVIECRADTWPPQFTLMPTLEPAVSLSELREWIVRFKPVICRFQPKSEPGDLANEQYYKSLIQLLIAKRVFAVAGWTLPSGAQENNVLVFPMNDQVLLGAFFPVSGIPEMPKPLPGIHALTSRHGSEIFTQLQRMPPEQRNYVIARLMQRQNAQPAGGLQALQTTQSQLHTQATPDRLDPSESTFLPPGLAPDSARLSGTQQQQQFNRMGHNSVNLSR